MVLINNHEESVSPVVAESSAPWTTLDLSYTRCSEGEQRPSPQS